MSEFEGPPVDSKVIVLSQALEHYRRQGQELPELTHMLEEVKAGNRVVLSNETNQLLVDAGLPQGQIDSAFFSHPIQAAVPDEQDEFRDPRY